MSMFVKDGRIGCVFRSPKEQKNLALERHACCK
jgi:hypothetical protein